MAQFQEFSSSFCVLHFHEMRLWPSLHCKQKALYNAMVYPFQLFNSNNNDETSEQKTRKQIGDCYYVYEVGAVFS